MDRLAQIRARQAEIQAELTELAAIDEPTDENASRSDVIADEFDTLEAEAAPLQARSERMERIRSAAVVPANRTAGSEPDSRSTESGRTRSGRNIYDIDALRNNPFAMDSASVRAELVTRAMDAIEDLPTRFSDDVRENATRMLENVAGDQTAAAVHILTTGNPTYRSAFKKILRQPALGIQALDGEEFAAARAAMSLSNANGGYMLPFELDPSIILTNAGTTNAIRAISRNVQTTQNVWHGVSSAGVTAEWTAEAARPQTRRRRSCSPVLPVSRVTRGCRRLSSSWPTRISKAISRC
jgi:hypothetical protein